MTRKYYRTEAEAEAAEARAEEADSATQPWRQLYPPIDYEMRRQARGVEREAYAVERAGYAVQNEAYAVEAQSGGWEPPQPDEPFPPPYTPDGEEARVDAVVDAASALLDSFNTAIESFPIGNPIQFRLQKLQETAVELKKQLIQERDKDWPDDIGTRPDTPPPPAGSLGRTRNAPGAD